LKPTIELLLASGWIDYELLDSGNGAKLERFGPYTFIRPEPQAFWKPRLSSSKWEAAHAVYQTKGEKSLGQWIIHKPIEPTWEMRYKQLKFWGRLGNSRHLGVFPEQAPHWEWASQIVLAAQRPVHILNLFGYTGMATLALSSVGAMVTHVDASKGVIEWAKRNQMLSGLENRPIRWIVDDALKFVRREVRRGVRYDGIFMDPPKFGRGPKGEVWESLEMLHGLIEACRQLLKDDVLFVIMTVYAIRASAISIYYALEEGLHGLKGHSSCGELAVKEKHGERCLSTAIYARWIGDQYWSPPRVD